MEAYPAEYVEHNLPLVLLSGLGYPENNGSSIAQLPRQESGTRFQCSSPECSGERAQLLLKHFQELDGTHRPWNANSLPSPGASLRYRIKAIGRVGMQGMKPVISL
jgi:solute carrier family 25 protein 38